MSIDSQLEDLVTYFSKFDKQTQRYAPLSKAISFLDLTQKVTQTINELLLVDGLDPDKIQTNFDKLSMVFQPDQDTFFSKEVLWLEESLSEGKQDGSCFGILNECYQKLIKPEEYKEILFQEIKNRDQFKRWLEQLKKTSETQTQKKLYDSLLELLNTSSSYFDEVGQIQPQGIRTLLTMMPVLLSGYGVVIFGKELFAVYALYFLISKGGKYLEKKDISELQHIGSALINISTVTATTMSTLIVRLTELVFLVSHGLYDVTVEIGKSIFSPMLISSSSIERQQTREDTFCQDLILASTHFDDSFQFQTPELQILTSPLRSYIGINEQQFFGSFRLGGEKNKVIKRLLSELHDLDEGTGLVDDKLIEAKKIIDKVRENRVIYSGQSACALDKAIQFTEFFLEKEPENEMGYMIYRPD